MNERYFDHAVLALGTCIATAQQLTRELEEANFLPFGTEGGALSVALAKKATFERLCPLAWQVKHPGLYKEILDLRVQAGKACTLSRKAVAYLNAEIRGVLDACGAEGLGPHGLRKLNQLLCDRWAVKHWAVLAMK